MTEKEEMKKYDGWTAKQYIQKMSSLMSRVATNDNWRRVNISEMYEVLYGKFVDRQFKNLLTLHEPSGDRKDSLGEVPFVNINWDSISPKINLLVNDLRGRGFDFDIKAKTKKSAVRKRRFINILKFMTQMQEINQKFAQVSGREYGINENLPKNAEEFKQEVQRYQDVYEVLMYEAVKRNLEESYYEDYRSSYMIEGLVGNEIHCKIENVNGFVYPRKVPSMHVLKDIGTADDFTSDSTFTIEAYYIPIAQAIERFNVDKEFVLQVRDSYKNDRNGFEGWKGVSVPERAGYYFEPFITKGYMDNPDRILVIECEFSDFQPTTKKLTFDKHDNIHLHTYAGKTAREKKLTTKERQDERNQIAEKLVEVKRHCVLLGGRILVEAGINGNQLREFSNPLKSHSNYVSIIIDYNAMQSTSLVEKIHKLQSFKNYVLTMMQKDVTTHIGSGIEVDFSLVDPEIYGDGKEALSNMLHVYKAHRVAGRNKSKFGGHPNTINSGNLINQIPAQTQSRILELMRVAHFVDQEIDKISGVNEARQGLGGEREGVGVNRARRSQSGLVTDTYFHSFYAWERRMIEKMCQHIKKVWKEHPEFYEVIAIDLGIDIPDDFNMDLETYRCVVKSFPLTKAELNAAVEAATAAGHLTFESMLELKVLIHENFKLGLMKFIEMGKQREERQFMMQQQQMQINQTLANQNNQVKLATAVQPAQIKADADVRQTGAKVEGENFRKELEVNQRDRRDISTRASDLEKNIINNRNQSNKDSKN